MRVNGSFTMLSDLTLSSIIIMFHVTLIISANKNDDIRKSNKLKISTKETNKSFLESLITK